MKAKVLIVDDEAPIRRLLRGTLERAGFEVAEAGTAREALRMAWEADPAIVLLDLGLPDREGMELVPLLAGPGRASILVVSARDATDEKVTALGLGASDYVTKPFDTAELVARIQAALRNRLTSAGGRTRVVAGGVTFDLLDHRVSKDGADLHLTPKEFGVVAALARFPGRVITHDQLLKSVWPNDYDRHIEYLRVVIRNIRHKIEDDPAAPQLIVNEPGVGYRLMGSQD